MALTDEQKEFLKSDDVISHLKETGVIKDINEDFITNYLSNDETGRKIANSMYDKEYDRRFKKWQSEKFPGILEEEIRKRTDTKEDPRDKTIREMREQQEKFQREIRMKDNKNYAISEATKVGLPLEFIDFIISDSEEVTKENLTKIGGLFKTHVDKIVQKTVEERLSGGHKPFGGGTGGGNNNLEYEKAKKERNSLDMLDIKLKNLGR